MGFRLVTVYSCLLRFAPTRSGPALTYVVTGKGIASQGELKMTFVSPVAADDLF